MRSVLPVRVQDRVTLVEGARVDAEERERADVRVGHDLEADGRERRVVGARTLRLGTLLAGLVDVEALDGGDVERARQVVDDGVEQRLHALVLEGRAAEDRVDREVDRGRADGLLEQVDRDVVALEVQLHHVVVVIGDGVEQLLASLLGLREQILGDVDDVDLLAEVVAVVDRLELDEVDDALEVALGADRQLDRDRVRTEAVDHRLHRHIA